MTSPINNRYIQYILYRIKILESRINLENIYISRHIEYKNKIVDSLRRAINRSRNSSEKAMLETRIRYYEDDCNRKVALRQQIIDGYQYEIDRLKAGLINTPPTPPTSPNPPTTPGTITQSTMQLIADQTKIAHQMMMNYLKNNWGVGEDPNDFVIPFIPQNFNLRLDSAPPNTKHSSEEWKNCIYPTLGESKIGGILLRNTYLELYGYFSARNTSKRLGELLPFKSPSQNLSIFNTGTYIAKKLYIPPNGLGDGNGIEASISYDINKDITSNTLFNSLGRFLDTTAINAISFTINTLSLWARQTGFLVPPPFCADRYWYDIYGDAVYQPTIKPITSMIKSDIICSTLYQPTCDLSTNTTYTNSCEANKDGANNLSNGVCYPMIRARNRSNLSVTQKPTVAISDEGGAIRDSKGQTITLPNILQAEYFARLYIFLYVYYMRNRNKISLNNLGVFAANELYGYVSRPINWRG